MTSTNEPPHDIVAEQAVLGVCMEAPAIVDHARKLLPDPRAFYRPQHQVLYAALLELADAGQPTDVIAVKGHLEQRGLLAQAGGPGYLFEVYQAAVLTHDVDYTARVVARHAAKRRIQQATIRAAAYAEDAEAQPLEVLTRIQDELAKAEADIAAGHQARRIRTLDEFLGEASDDDSYDWIVPQVLERHDRLILTGPEGKGKSTFLRQFGIQAAAGIHPFTGEAIKPARVLYVDLENSERQSRRKLRPLRVKAGSNLQEGNFHIEIRMAGLDLGAAADVAWLIDTAAAVQPDILITGPIYKMATGNPNDEKEAKPVAMALDRLRSTIGCALLLEAHTAKKPVAAKAVRPKEPFGWSGWLRWPEFGIYLDEDGTLSHWRGERDERNWPSALRRGGEWPWTPLTSGSELLWLRILAAREEFGQSVTYRDLVTLVGASLAQIQRAIQPNKAQWLAVNGSAE